MSVGDYITRSEYEARHSELRTEMLRLNSTTDAIRSDIQARFDVMATKLEKMDDKIDNSRVAVWKMLAVSVVNFVLGGGVVAFIQITHVVR
jgi:hypothetical protein